MSVILAMAGVAHYNSPNCSELPYCINDVNAIKESFSRGLRVDKIINSGKDGFITKKDFISSLAVCSNMCKEEDILILYFSGHGNDDFEMCFTDETLSIQELINYLENNIIARHKILILDCCHAGHFTIESPKNKIRNIKDILSYKSQGLAVFASCHGEELSGFCATEKISQFTYLICDAFSANYLIKKGKKSLEEIKDHLEFLVENSLIKEDGQHPIFDTSLIGTVYFNVENYVSYISNKIYKECDEFIIYSVEPLHTFEAKRYAVKIILKVAPTKENISKITLETRAQLLYAEVYKNKEQEKHHKGRKTNIFFCYFAVNEDELLGSIYMFRSIWVDGAQDKNHWYKEKNSSIINNVCIIPQAQYAFIKMFPQIQISDDEFYSQTQLLLKELIVQAEELRGLYQKYKNTLIPLEDLFEAAYPINHKISNLYFKLGNIPCPPKNMIELSEVSLELAGSIHDMSLFFNSNNINQWTEEDRDFLMDKAIKDYCLGLNRLELLKLI